MKTASRPASAPVIFTTYDIGRMTGTDPTTVHKWIDKGLLRGYRTPGGHRRVRAEDLRLFLNAHAMPIPRELGGAEALKVMLVDADAEALRSGVRALRKLRPAWELVTAASGVDALLGFSSAPPDVLVFDFSVEDLDGLKLFEGLRKRPDTASVRMVALADSPSSELGRLAVAAGAASVIAKPAAAPALVEAIELAAGLRPGFQTA